MTTNVNRFADVLFQAVNGVSRASVGQGSPPVAYVKAFRQSLDLWDEALPLVTVEAGASSVSQTLDGGAQRDDYAFDIDIYGQTPEAVAEVVDLVEGYLKRNARTWDEVSGQQNDEANYEYFYSASIQPTAFQPATSRSTSSGGSGGVPPDGSVGMDQLAQSVRDAINASFVAVQPDGLDARFITQGGDTADDDRTLGKSVVLFALGGVVASVTKVSNSLHVATYDRDGVQTVTTISLPSGSGSSSHTDEQIEHLAGALMTLAFPGVTYDPGTGTFGGRRQTSANYPHEPADLATNAVVDKLTADLSNAGKLAALQTLLKVALKLKVLSAVPASSAGYADGDLINVNGDLMELVASGGDANVIGGVAGHDGQNFLGADNVPDGVEYGTINGNIVASVTWANDTAEGVPLTEAQLPIASAGAPGTVYMRLTTQRGADSDHILTRNSGHDSTSNEGDVIGYSSATTGERAGIEAGEHFEARFFTNPDFRTGPLALHSADRFENWLVRKLGTLSVPTDAEIRAIADQAAETRYPDSQQTKLINLPADAQSAAQVAALIALSVNPGGLTATSKDDRADYIARTLNGEGLLDYQTALRNIPSELNYEDLSTAPTAPTPNQHINLLDEDTIPGYGVLSPESFTTGGGTNAVGYSAGTPPIGGIDVDAPGLETMAAYHGSTNIVQVVLRGTNTRTIQSVGIGQGDNALTSYSAQRVGGQQSKTYRITGTNQNTIQDSHLYRIQITYTDGTKEFADTTLTLGRWIWSADLLRWVQQGQQWTRSNLVEVIDQWWQALGVLPRNRLPSLSFANAEVAELTITSANQSQQTLVISNAANLGATGSIVVVEFEVVGGPAWSTNFRLVNDRDCMVKMLTNLTGAEYAVSIRSRQTENDIRITRRETGAFPQGVVRVYNL